jgi:hypothetical protein
VVHQQLGVDPDLGHGLVSVVPQLPAGQTHIAGSDIAVGNGHLDVRADRRGKTLTVTVDAAIGARLSTGVVLPAGTSVASATLDGHRVSTQVTPTTRGDALLTGPSAAGRHTLVVTLRQP